MKETIIRNYTAPQISVIEFEIEKGFAGSSDENVEGTTLDYSDHTSDEL